MRECKRDEVQKKRLLAAEQDHRLVRFAEGREYVISARPDRIYFDPCEFIDYKCSPLDILPTAHELRNDPVAICYAAVAAELTNAKTVKATYVWPFYRGRGSSSVSFAISADEVKDRLRLMDIKVAQFLAMKRGGTRKCQCGFRRLAIQESLQ